jgi:D-alanyl-lipoteichoic acid acyltransferase DltB (MBOAT superfamily)
VILFRVFPWDQQSEGSSAGGPLFVPRLKQGSGRHDIPERDGVFYCSTNVTSAIAEAIQSFRGRKINNQTFQRVNGWILSLVSYNIQDDKLKIENLDHPKNLAKRGLIPSQIATNHRPTTQNVARRLYDEGLSGFSWWSALEASWQNVTLFENRVKKHLEIKDAPKILQVQLEEVQNTAYKLNIELE